MSNPPPAVSYVPPANENGFYEALFSAADTAKSGQINGRDAVSFLSRSKLPLDLLKNIWTMADNPKTNHLDKKKFYAAVRLIQLYQNGQKANGANLGTAENVIMRPPFFEGITGGAGGGQGQGQPQPQQQPHPPAANAASPIASPITSPVTSPIPSPTRPTLDHNQSNASSIITATPQPQPQPLRQSANNTLATQDPYIMTPADRSRYDTLFPQYEKEGYVYGKEAVDLFTKSGLDKGLLRDIWNMVDVPVDNRLSRVEFAISMHLIVCISKKNLPMPQILPPSLTALRDQEIAATGVSGPVAGADSGVNVDGGGGGGDGGIPSPEMVARGPAAPVGSGGMSMTGPPTGMGLIPSPQMQQSQTLQPPPQPIRQSFTSSGGLPGMSIHDAFENVHNERASIGSDTTPPARRHSQQQRGQIQTSMQQQPQQQQPPPYQQQQQQQQQ
mmetsp:Transcript_21043/g.24360  ORF Transcript_21043/g.24360 Transcript_21043/m.24360 type:complete len:444 (+) Transcript_21043:109-1440(+)